MHENYVTPAASFCHHVAAWTPEILLQLLFVKNHRPAYRSTRQPPIKPEKK